jgi:hypothetical protein
MNSVTTPMTSHHTEGTSNWEGVVKLLKEEMSETGHAVAMEERIIKTSLLSIVGPHRASVLRLFKAFALAAEDVRLSVTSCRVCLCVVASVGLCVWLTALECILTLTLT